MSLHLSTSSQSGWHRPIVGVGFFLSGFAALVYEVCWIRQACLVFGSTTQALSTVLAVFFFGFALGSYLFGSRAERIERPLLWVAALELTLAVSAIVSLWAWRLAEGWYGAVYRASGNNVGLVVTQILGTALVLLVPTLAMGGTLPLMCQEWIRHSNRIARTTGSLYSLNTLGAAAGCIVAGTALIPALGVQRTIALAAVLNLFISAVFWSAARSKPVGQLPQAAQPSHTAGVSGHTQLVVLCLVFVVGMTALGYEVLWTRFLALIVRTSVYTYTMTLAVVLAGIATGSWMASLWFDQSSRRVFWFGAIQVALGLVVLWTLLLPPAYWADWAQETIWVCGLLLAPGAVLSGMSFPLAVRIVSEDIRLTGRNVGRLAAANTLGGIVGSLAMGFVALPSWGLHASLLISTAVCLAGGCIAWLLLDRPQPRWPRLGFAAIACGAWLMMPRLMTTQLPADFLAEPSQLIDFREGAASNVAVVQKQESRRLEIDRWWQGSAERGHQIMAAHLPMLMRPQAKRVLVVGGGLGQTASRFLMYGVEKLDCVEIEPAVFDLVAEHFDAQWMNDPRVALLIEDGRSYLSHTDTKYDVISLELGQVFRPGVASFYTADFYHRARQRLSAGGVISQFVPVPFFRPHEFRSVLHTFQQVFPFCYLWYNTSELLLIGALEPIHLDAGRVAAAWSPEVVQQDLQYSHWGGPHQWVRHQKVLLSCFLAGPAEIEELAHGGEVYRDDRPVLEYSAAKIRSSEVNEVAVSELLGKHLSHFSSVFDGQLFQDELAEIQDLRRRHLADMVSAGLMRAVEPLDSAREHPEVVNVLAQALRWNNSNVRANRLMGESLVELGRPSDARPFLEQAVKVAPDNPLAHRALGVALHRMGEPVEAMEHYRKAVAARPNDSELLNNLGVALAQTGQIGDAVAHFRRALDLQPGYADAQRNLAQALRVQNTNGAPRQPSRAP